MRGTTKGEYNIPLQGSYRCHYGDPRPTCDSDAKSDKYSESARLYKLGVRKKLRALQWGAH